MSATAMKYAVMIFLVLLAWFTPLMVQHVRTSRWRALPGHNPYKPGDSE